LLVEAVAAAPFAAANAVVSVPVQDPAPPPGQGEEFGKASPIALVVIILLAIATVMLIRGMAKRIRRLPATFDQPGEHPGDEHGDRPAEQPAGVESQPGSKRDTEDAGREGS
jgi:hypothetical protein